MIQRSAVFLFLAFALFINGCATRQMPLNGKRELFNNFRLKYSHCNGTGMKATASLFYTAEGKGHRTTMTLWGNLEAPLRLDVRAGIGAYIAHILEDNSGLTAFYPGQKTAYTHSSPEKGVELLGLPFPFSLKDLAGLVSCCYQSLIPDDYNSVNYIHETGNLQYIFNKGPVSSITLTRQGVPVTIIGHGESPWRMELTSYADNGAGKMLADKITVFTENGDKAVLRIKSRQFTTEKWPADSLEMELPEGTETVALDQNGYLKIN